MLQVLKRIIKSAKINSFEIQDNLLTENCQSFLIKIKEKNKKENENEKEKKDDPSLSLINISHTENTGFMIEFDKFKFLPENVFNSDIGINKTCDSIIFIQHQKKLFSICCELKSSEPNLPKVIGKFQTAACFLDVLSSIYKNYPYAFKDQKNNESSVFKKTAKKIEFFPQYYVFYDHKKSKNSEVNRRTTGIQRGSSPENPIYLASQNGDYFSLLKLINATAKGRDADNKGDTP